MGVVRAENVRSCHGIIRGLCFCGNFRLRLDGYATQLPFISIIVYEPGDPQAAIIVWLLNNPICVWCSRQC
jgi:hypothetical protein